MIEIKKLEINLKEYKVVAENIHIIENEKVLITAKNNSGKSIFLLGLTGLIKTTSRDIIFFDTHCKQNLWQNFTGMYYDQSSLIPYLTPHEYFMMCGNLKGLPKGLTKTNYERYSDYLFLPKNEKKYIKELSLGTQKKIGLIATLLGNNKIILWDEPFTNLDDESCQSLALLIENELKDITILLTSPNVELPYEKSTSKLLIKEGIVKKM
ncbi:ATP-binding cassette domain-containing protein [Belliella kenyensis]|uniref:ATP-binding cassette domain-containing protein n=1 Tax=Belliella kenyensis TaxID=1472724 RepID=A0ABV8EIL3_9BACT|nr:ATP-binding cassette domain-containing protein [Belliella kenyensis]MCH7400943.1 ATP-binding cassette domain-containing protein [Belliella kenyensis]MDN3603941.1 ATP-binding cassette domain-containing protein [Belliella kenyensis]